MESSSPLSETVKNVNKRRSTLPPQLLEPEFFPECWKTLLNGSNFLSILKGVNIKSFVVILL